MMDENYAPIMLTLNRAAENPLISPMPEHDWEANAAFNPCVLLDNGVYHMLYRALSPKVSYYGIDLELSTIGYAMSTDGIHFTGRKQFIKPEHDWEFYGCEDPRVTKIDDTFYIFYTALSTFPFSPGGIKVGLAITKDFQTIEQKHLVTPFNAKAMSLFPQKINGRFTGILTVDTDKPPAKIGLAYFDRIEEIWDHVYWENWYAYIQDHTLHLQRNDQDHVEIGAPPLKTNQGWLLVYSYIQNYFSNRKVFGIEGVMLQENNPLKITSRTEEAVLLPEVEYENIGLVPNIVFPSGAVADNDTLSVYYGGADTVSCLATCNLSALLRDMRPEKQLQASNVNGEIGTVMFKRFEENPILKPLSEHEWEKKAVFNPAALLENGTVHLFYRAVSETDVSVIGYAESKDGFHITNRYPDPIFLPHASFEVNAQGKNYGCEDPRVTKIDDNIYMCYTAYDGINVPRVALTGLKVQDLLSQKWNWTAPKLISPPGLDDKDACLFPRKIQDKYYLLHRLQTEIWLDSVDDLDFTEGKIVAGEVILKPRPDKWDSSKISIAAPPLETKDGWVLLYNGIDKNEHYNVGALLMDLENPSHILSRLDYPVFIPETAYEKEGLVPNVVFPCGTVILDGTLHIYYGAADKVTGVAYIEMAQLQSELLRFKA